MDIVPTLWDRNAQTHVNVVTHLQTLLAESIKGRAEIVDRYLQVMDDPSIAERHWFVPGDPDGAFCAACSLPSVSRRHVRRAA